MQKILITGGSGFIGSYLVDALLKQNTFEILNVDVANPPEEKHKQIWSCTSILDREKLLSVFNQFKPHFVIHLAARTDTEPENVLEDYKVNTEGTANVLEAIKKCGSVQRTIITSTQFVNQYRGLPSHDRDYAPHTVYGESKVITEELTRKADLQCCWTIIRPTNIWGPRHPRYPKEFWFVLKKNKYVHPGREIVIRSYGYVGNVAEQILQLLKQDPDKIHQQVFYVGDEPINLHDWVNGFSLALNNKNVKVVPRFVVKGAAVIGEVLKKANIKFPITLSRYKSMTESNSAPMEKTFQILGPVKYSLQDGIDETVEWLKERNQFWLH